MQIDQQNLSLKVFGEKVDALEPQSALQALFKKNFSQQIVEFKTLKKNSPEFKNHYSLMLYQKVLLKIIDLVGERQYALKKADPKFLETFPLSELNDYYTKYFLKYRKTPQQITWKGLIKNSRTLFLDSCKLLEPAVIQQRKELADKGYSMVQELEKWINTSLLNENASFEDLVLELTKEFLEWADTHPKAASYLISDVALTCSILLEKDVVERLFTSLDAMIVSRLFFDALGLSPEYEKIEEDDLLKFRALADFMTYCPKLATVGQIVKRTAKGEFTSLSSWILNVMKETAGTLLTQKIVQLVPKGKERFVSFLIDTCRGKELHEILAHQRNLTLIQIAGTVRQVMKHSHPVFLTLEIWWKTVFEAEGRERKERVITQILMPIGSVVLFTASFFVSLRKSLFLFSASLMTIGSSLMLTWLIDEKTRFKTKLAVEAYVFKRERERQRQELNHFLKQDREVEEQILREARLYIQDLQKRYAIPVSLKKEPCELGDEYQTRKSKILRGLKKQEISKDKIISAVEAVSIFNKVLKIKELRKKLEAKDAKISDAIIYSLIEELTKEWLQPAITRAFKDRLIETSLLTEEDHARRSKIEIGSTPLSLEKFFKSKAKAIQDPYQKKLYTQVISNLSSQKPNPFFSI